MVEDGSRLSFNRKNSSLEDALKALKHLKTEQNKQKKHSGDVLKAHPDSSDSVTGMFQKESMFLHGFI